MRGDTRTAWGASAGKCQDHPMGILSIQSLVAYGHAGNSAALFPLQRLGRVVWPVMTVHFSNHTGYGDWRGPLLTAQDVADVIAGVEDRGAFASCEAVLSGYQGAEDVGAVVLDAVDAGQEGVAGGGLLLRPGDGRRGPRHVRAARHPGVHAGPGGARGGRGHAQPLRAGLPGRHHDDDPRRAARGRRPGPGERPVRRTGHQHDPRGHPRRRARHGGGLGRRGLAHPHARGWRSARRGPGT